MTQAISRAISQWAESTAPTAEPYLPATIGSTTYKVTRATLVGAYYPVLTAGTAAAAANTAAINAAVVAANAASVALTGPVSVVLPNGLYWLTDSGGQQCIVMQSKVWLRGAGRDETILKMVNGGDSHIINCAGKDSFSITDMTIDGNKANQTLHVGVHGIRVFAGSYITLERLRVQNCAYYGIGIQKTDSPNTTNSIFRDLLISGNGGADPGFGDGFDIKLCEDCYFENIQLWNNEQRGLDVRGKRLSYNSIWAWGNGSTGITLRVIDDNGPSGEHFISAVNCFSFRNGGEGFAVLNNEAPIVGMTAHHKLVNCRAWENTLQGFLIGGITMQAEFVSCSAYSNLSSGFYIVDCDDEVKFTDCDAVGNQDGFYCFSATCRVSATDCTARGNTSTNQVYFAGPRSTWKGGTIDASGKTRGITVAPTAIGTLIHGVYTRNGASGDCIRLEADRCTVRDCSFGGTTGGALTILAGVDDTRVLNNDFTDVTGGAGKVGDSGTRTIRRDNIGGVTNRETDSADTSVNISAGVITISGNRYSVAGQGGVADDLDTINGGLPDQELVLTAYDTAVTITVKDGTGNLRLAGDFPMDNSEDVLVLRANYDGTVWLEQSRSNNGA